MLKAVVDTNVVVSAMLSPQGNPARIINMIFDDKLQVYYSLGILAEYTDVLARPRLNIAPETQSNFLEAFTEAGKLLDPPASNIPFSDESDRIFYDTARSGDAILITGNAKHYPAEPFIMNPSDFLKVVDGA